MTEMGRSEPTLDRSLLEAVGGDGPSKASPASPADVAPLPQPDNGASSDSSSISTQVGLMVAVVVLGCANNISKQIAAKPLHRYTYMLGLSTSVVYVPLFGGTLLLLLRSKVVPRHQLAFVYERPAQRGIPMLVMFAVAALGDTLGDIIGMICTPYVQGPVHSLLSNMTPVFIALLSWAILQKRYSLMQCCGLLGVLTAVCIGVLPSFKAGSSSKATKPFYAAVLAGSCIFNAISFVVKELIFFRYMAWKRGHGIRERSSGLNVFVVNTHAVLFQLPLTLLALPLNVALGQTNGEGMLPYFREAFHCVFSGKADSCGPDSDHADLAFNCTLVYVVFNVLWNVSVLLSVKHSGALATFVALKAIFPVSTLMFAYIDWPLLGTTPMNGLVWLSLIIILPATAFYKYATGQQQLREVMDPALASCCWPLGAGPSARRPLRAAES